MAILVDETTRVLVQGITGREGRARAALMRDYGTRLIAGCTPGRGGETVDGVPVYDTVAEAVEAHGGFDASVVFVPAPLVKDAALEAIAAGVKLIVLVGDRVPVWDVMEIARAARAAGVDFLGPEHARRPVRRQGRAGDDRRAGRSRRAPGSSRARWASPRAPAA